MTRLTLLSAATRIRLARDAGTVKRRSRRWAWDPPAEPPDWLAEVTRPLVLVTTSSEFQDDGRLVRTALAALAEEEVEVVATLPAVDGEGAGRGLRGRFPAAGLPARSRSSAGKVREAMRCRPGVGRIAAAFEATGGPVAAADAVVDLAPTA